MNRLRVLVVATVGVLALAGTASSARGPGGPSGEGPLAGQVIPYVIVHDTHKGKEHGNGGPPGGGGGGDAEPVDHSGHFVLLPGAWANPNVSYVVEDPGIPGAVDAVEQSFEAWEAVSGISFSLTGTQAVNASQEASGPSGQNTVSWALLTGSWTNALAVTLIWIEDSNGNNAWDAGEPVVENDLFFNSKYQWGIDPDGDGPATPALKGKWYDIQNVGTHEAGHFVGLDDQFQWSDETMYGSAGSRETKKRTLEAGDIAGAQALYGT